MTQTDRGRQRVCAIDWQLISNFNPKQFRCWDFDSTKNTTQHSTFTDSIEGCEIVIPQQARRSNDFIRVWQPSQLLQLKCQINANITKHKHTHTHSHKDHVTHECGVLAPSDVDALWCFSLFRFRLSVLVLNDKMMNSYWATFAPPKPKSNPYLVSSLFYSIAVGGGGSGWKIQWMHIHDEITSKYISSTDPSFGIFDSVFCSPSFLFAFCFV